MIWSDNSMVAYLWVENSFSTIFKKYYGWEAYNFFDGDRFRTRILFFLKGRLRIRIFRMRIHNSEFWEPIISHFYFHVNSFEGTDFFFITAHNLFLWWSEKFDIHYQPIMVDIDLCLLLGLINFPIISNMIVITANLNMHAQFCIWHDSSTV